MLRKDVQRQQFRPAQVQLNPGDLHVGRAGPMTEPKYVPRRADFKLGRGQTLGADGGHLARTVDCPR